MLIDLPDMISTEEWDKLTPEKRMNHLRTWAAMLGDAFGRLGAEHNGFGQRLASVEKKATD